MTSQKIILSEILSELKNVRNDVNNLQRTNPKQVQTSVQQHQRTSPPTRQLLHNNMQPAKPTKIKTTVQQQGPLPPAQQLLHNIANRPMHLPKCWYHKQHGIATNPKNCPGPEFCSFNLRAEILKMKKLIAMHSDSPLQQRITVARKIIPKTFEPKKNAEDTLPTTQIVTNAQLTIPLKNCTITEEQPAATNLASVWNDEINNTIDHTNMDLDNTLEEELLSVSP